MHAVVLPIRNLVLSLQPMSMDHFYWINMSQGFSNSSFFAVYWTAKLDVVNFGNEVEFQILMFMINVLKTQLPVAESYRGSSYPVPSTQTEAKNGAALPPKLITKVLVYSCTKTVELHSS